MITQTRNLMVAACFALGATVANAAPIVGQLDIAGQGQYQFDTYPNPSSITEIEFLSANTTGATGDFDGIANGTAVTVPGTWDLSTPEILWEVGGFTFTLENITTNEVSASGTSAVVVGTGWVTADGYDATFGYWSLSTQYPGGLNETTSFSFSSTTVSVDVPEPATLGLLGAGLLGLGIARRRARNA